MAMSNPIRLSYVCTCVCNSPALCQYFCIDIIMTHDYIAEIDVVNLSYLLTGSRLWNFQTVHKQREIEFFHINVNVGHSFQLFVK